MLYQIVLIILFIMHVFLYRRALTTETNAKNVSSEAIGGYVYEDPDRLGNRGQGNYELTQCPAYESTTSKPQPAQESSHYEL